MKKWQIESSETLETLKSWKYYSEFSYFRVFDFALQQNRKLGYKYLGKIFPIFPRFPSFRPGCLTVPKTLANTQSFYEKHTGFTDISHILSHISPLTTINKNDDITSTTI